MPGKSIGGVKLGMSKSRVAALWGKPNPLGMCDHAYIKGAFTCVWTHKGALPYYGDGDWYRGGAEGVQVDFVHRRVFSIKLQSNEWNGADPGGLSGWKTDSGIGLGATHRAVHHAYPHARSTLHQEGMWGYELLFGPKHGLGFFYDRPGSADDDRVLMIGMN